MRAGTVAAVCVIGLLAWYVVGRLTALEALEPLRIEALVAEPSDAAGAAAPAGQAAGKPAARVEADLFHPDHQPGPDGKRPPLPQPAFGGRAVVHLERLPRSLNNVLENLGVVRRMHGEIHETLLLRDWDTLELRGNLASAWTVEDVVHVRKGKLQPGLVDLALPETDLVRGRVVEEGDRLLVERPYPTAIGVRELARADVERVERGTCITFTLRAGVRWHDGHEFDAGDVRYSLELYQNPLVDCGQRRQQYEKILAVETPDARTVRVWFDRQYYFALDSLGIELTLLPAHLYDLADPDHAAGRERRAREPGWVPSDAERAEALHKNPHNREWIGLGPYRVTRFDAELVQAERFDGYFDPANSGYLDTLVWRYVKDDAVAFQALVNGELDLFARMSSEDYFGPATEAASFTQRNYKGHFYSGNYWYVAWNLTRPALADVRVRRALAHAIDLEAFKRSFYKGVADLVTGPWMLSKPEYDRAIAPLAHDPALARTQLAEAGWLDRDRDGVVEKDGVPLKIEFLLDGGNAVNKAFAAQMQQDLAAVGVQLEVKSLDAAAITERRNQRDFDALPSAWALTWETDPEQIWHSRSGQPGARGANYIGFADARCDELIERGQRELDTPKRAAIWRALHARIYELQPYLFCYAPPRKFGLNRALRGVQLVAMDPNYVLRRWYYPAGTAGTRATRERPAAGGGR